MSSSHMQNRPLGIVLFGITSLDLHWILVFKVSFLPITILRHFVVLMIFIMALKCSFNAGAVAVGPSNNWSKLSFSQYIVFSVYLHHSLTMSNGNIINTSQGSASCVQKVNQIIWVLVNSVAWQQSIFKKWHENHLSCTSSFFSTTTPKNYWPSYPSYFGFECFPLQNIKLSLKSGNLT